MPTARRSSPTAPTPRSLTDSKTSTASRCWSWRAPSTPRCWQNITAPRCRWTTARSPRTPGTMIMFTSGSTGAPKAVPSTQGRITASATGMAGQFGLGRDSVCYIPMPLFHGNAVMANWAPALHARAATALRRRFSASGFLQDVRRYGATYFTYVGRAVSYILANPLRTRTMPTTRWCSATAPRRPRRPRSAARAFEERFGCPLREGYGSSGGGVAFRWQRRAPSRARHRPGAPRPGRPRPRLDRKRVPACRVRRARPPAQRRRGDRGTSPTPSRAATSRGTGATRTPRRPGSRTGCSGPAICSTATPTTTCTSPVVATTGCAWTARTWPCTPLRASSPATAPSPPSPSTPRPTRPSGTWSWPPPSLPTKPLSTRWSSQPSSRRSQTWAPRCRRASCGSSIEIPVTASQQDGQERPAARGVARTADPVWWQPERGAACRLMTDEDREALAKAFAEHRRERTSSTESCPGLIGSGRA
ncbi:AMP-binding protein [Yinghuangia aomiensis]